MRWDILSLTILASAIEGGGPKGAGGPKGGTAIRAGGPKGGSTGRGAGGGPKGGSAIGEAAIL